MNLQGLTSEFSLPELFQFLQESQQTGRLSLRPVKGSHLENKPHFFWFEKGNLLAASDRLDGLGLLHIMQTRSLITSAVQPRLLRQCPRQVALGNFLKDRAVLTGKQLKSLFAFQILKHMCALLKATDIRFAFRESYPLSYLEMTGVKTRATDVTLPSLRILKDWGTLVDKLPSPESGLNPVEGKQLSYRLQTQEKNVLRLAQTGMSLAKISKTLKLSTLDVQKTGFRLIFVGIAKEVPMIDIANSHSQPKRQLARLSESFLGKLSGYLQKGLQPAPATASVSASAYAEPYNSAAVSYQSIASPDKMTISDKAIDLSNTARNSAVQRISNIVGIDRVGQLAEVAPACLLVQYPSCLLARGVA